MFDHGAPFVDTTTLIDGDTPLLVLCYSGNWSREAFEILFQRGSSVMELDSQGRTCLHLCLGCDFDLAEEPMYGAVHRLKNGLIFLIGNGAEIDVKDYDRESVSDIAYYNTSENLGSLVGDVWDCALASCGHESPISHQGLLRKAAYTSLYGRRHSRTRGWGLSISARTTTTDNTAT